MPAGRPAGPVASVNPRPAGGISCKALATRVLRRWRHGSATASTARSRSAATMARTGRASRPRATGMDHRQPAVRTPHRCHQTRITGKLAPQRRVRTERGDGIGGVAHRVGDRRVHRLVLVGVLSARDRGRSLRTYLASADAPGVPGKVKAIAQALARAMNASGHAPSDADDGPASVFVDVGERRQSLRPHSPG